MFDSCVGMLMDEFVLVLAFLEFSECDLALSAFELLREYSGLEFDFRDWLEME